MATVSLAARVWPALLVGFIVAMPVPLVMAQSGGSFAVRSSTVDGGGASATGGGVRVGATAGQPDAGILVGGGVTLAGGFWVPSRALPAACGGDCAGDGEVTVDDLVRLVNIALGNAPLSECRAGDTSGDGEITIDEILLAVNTALTSC